MNFDDAVRLTSLLTGLAFAQQSLEHCVARGSERVLFAVRLVLSLLLVFGIYTEYVLGLLMLLGLLILYRFQGPYNGGSDRMSLLVLFCLCLVQFLPVLQWKQVAFGYLAFQLVLSYFISGWVKVVNPEWRSGLALQDVFRFSAYPVSEGLRRWAERPRMLLFMSWGVILFELVFPLALLSTPLLVAALFIAASFHFSNACLFGLNRFFWIWVSAYPSILWLQQRVDALV